jgi:hypothetical protein
MKKVRQQEAGFGSGKFPSYKKCTPPLFLSCAILFPCQEQTGSSYSNCSESNRKDNNGINQQQYRPTQ